MGIFVALVAIFFMVAAGRGYLRGKVNEARRRYETAEKDAVEKIQQGITRHPTWIKQPEWAKSLVTTTNEAALKAGMSQDQAKRWFARQDVADSIMTMAAELEKVGFSKLEQISLSYDFTLKLAKLQLKA
ncbi:hypothetical protein [Celeribacter sp.]|uniref:hypothetical protein n=1 Tax=Celeribacter sp. TaxID=1890673 RepID=UPI003A92C1D1